MDGAKTGMKKRHSMISLMLLGITRDWDREE